MDLPGKCEIVREYDIDDPAIRNIVQEINGEEGVGVVPDYMNRISELLESIENRKINALVNFMLYGMILNDGRDMEALRSIQDDISEYMDAYYLSLDDIEDTIAANDNFKMNLLPELVNELRLDKDFYKTHKKDINVLVGMLPDIRENLEFISKVLLGV